MSPSAQTEQELDALLDATLAATADDGGELCDEVLERAPGAQSALVIIVSSCRRRLDDSEDVQETRAAPDVRPRSAIVLVSSRICTGENVEEGIR